MKKTASRQGTWRLQDDLLEKHNKIYENQLQPRSEEIKTFTLIFKTFFNQFREDIKQKDCWTNTDQLKGRPALLGY